jgi:hypothetical protein
MSAVTTFADPSVNFALQFQTVEDGSEDLLDEGDLAAFPTPDAGEPRNDEQGREAPAAGTAKADDDGATPDGEGEGGGDDKVVTLDNFRKK